MAETAPDGFVRTYPVIVAFAKMDLDLVAANHRINGRIEKIVNKFKTQLIAIEFCGFYNIGHHKLRNKSFEFYLAIHLRALTTHIFMPRSSIDVVFGSNSATILPSLITSSL